MAFDRTFELSSLDGTNGFWIDGQIDGFRRAGMAVSDAGDSNSDGISDIIIGWPAVVVFGSGQGFDVSLDLSTLDGSNGFAMFGIDSEDNLGEAVSNAGDINDDGISDLVIGAPNALGNQFGSNERGETYVVFGSDRGFDADLDLSTLDGSNGFVMPGIDPGDNLGKSVSSAGDVNDDGIADLLICASGKSYVVFGSEQSFDASLDLSTLDGNNGFVMNRGSRSLSAAGDVNGDGIDDVVIGSPGASPNGVSHAGITYVMFGSDQGFDASVDLVTLDGNNGFKIIGSDELELSGYSVSGAGDINADGVDDLIIADRAERGPGKHVESYVVFGTDQGFEASMQLSALDGSNGFVITGINSKFLDKESVSGAGDVNADGIDDLIIGAGGANVEGATDAGKSYVIFGTDQGFDASLNVQSLNGSNGLVILGIEERDTSGYAVSGAGDVNSDGFDDLLIGSRASETYVVFGQRSAPRPDAVDDSFEIDADDIGKKGAKLDVLANDIAVGPALDAKSIEITDDPDHGTTVTKKGVVYYTPDEGYDGADSLLYTVADKNGAVSDEATVTLDIEQDPGPVDNEPPVAVDDAFTVDGLKAADKAVKVDVVKNDVRGDAKIDKKSVEVTDSPDHGEASVKKGVIYYQPDPDYEGADTLQYTVADKDGVVSGEATVSLDVTLPEPPDAVDDDYTIAPDDIGKKGAKLDILSNDIAGGAKLVAKSVEITDAPDHGTAALKKGVIYYTPDEGYDGADTLLYTVADKNGMVSDEATVRLDIEDAAAPASLVSSAESLTVDDLVSQDDALFGTAADGEGLGALVGEAAVSFAAVVMPTELDALVVS